jgi:MFS family permease
LPVSLKIDKYERAEKVYQAHTNRCRVGVHLRKTVKHNKHKQNISPEQPITPPDTQAITTSNTHIRDPYQALRYHDYRLLLAGTFVAVIGEQMVNVALGWDLYNRTGSSLVLGLVGLMLVLPVILFSLPAGHVADQYNRKHIVVGSLFLLTIGSLGLTILSLLNGAIFLIYACLLVIGTAQAFNSPASSTLVAQIVPEEAYESAATWSSSSWQLASVIGPALGGLFIGVFHTATFVYAFNAVATLLFAFLLLQIRSKQHLSGSKEPMTWRSLVEGLNFIHQTKIVLAAITLDLFAVLLGGATTLLPVFAKDILHVGPEGLGWLRAAPSIGAVCVALSIAHLPPFKKAGYTLLLAVIGFGIATIVFGLSRSFWLSLVMLFILGGLDNISVVIRSTLILTKTPDEMRGRASSVNSLFVAMSNQLGGFESGVTAQLFGPILSVVGGGVGTILVVLAVALLWPEMRKMGSLNTQTTLISSEDDAHPVPTS